MLRYVLGTIGSTCLCLTLLFFAAAVGEYRARLPLQTVQHAQPAASARVDYQTGRQPERDSDALAEPQAGSSPGEAREPQAGESVEIASALPDSSKGMLPDPLEPAPSLEAELTPQLVSVPDPVVDLSSEAQESTRHGARATQKPAPVAWVDPPLQVSSPEGMSLKVAETEVSAAAFLDPGSAPVETSPPPETVARIAPEIASDTFDRGRDERGVANQPVHPIRPEARATREARARDLAVDYLAVWSSANDGAVEALTAFYGSVVNFYGKQVHREQLAREKQAFIKRWPGRHYAPRLGSADVRCSQTTDICTVSSVYDYTVSNARNGRRASGTQKLELRVSFASGDPVIVHENGKRSIEPVQAAAGPAAVPGRLAGERETASPSVEAGGRLNRLAVPLPPARPGLDPASRRRLRSIAGPRSGSASALRRFEAIPASGTNGNTPASLN